MLTDWQLAWREVAAGVAEEPIRCSRDPIAADTARAPSRRDTRDTATRVLYWTGYHEVPQAVALTGEAPPSCRISASGSRVEGSEIRQTHSLRPVVDLSDSGPDSVPSPKNSDTASP
ncbi:hypothetical protein Jiend_54180 [Micromonospora endophytica]|nr:hypothetical protein Jiend_54180 [Micromonospora endophytica]